MTTYDYIIAFKGEMSNFTMFKIHEILTEFNFVLELNGYYNYQLHGIEETDTYPEATIITSQAICQIANNYTGGWIEYQLKGYTIVVDYQKALDLVDLEGSFIALFIPIQLYKNEIIQFDKLLKRLTCLYPPLKIDSGKEFIDKLDVEEYFYDLSKGNPNLE